MFFKQNMENSGNATTVKRVFIVAASPIIRAGLERIVESDENLIVAGVESSIEQFDDLSIVAPNVLLIDVERESESFIENLQTFSHESVRTAIVLLVNDEEDSNWIIAAFSAGANAVLARNAASEEILAAIKIVNQDLVVLPKDIFQFFQTTSGLNSIKVSGGQKNGFDKKIESLTAREIEVLELLAEGLSNKIIGYRLDISEHTVKFHVSSILAKLGAATRTEAVTEGLRRGFVLL